MEPPTKPDATDCCNSGCTPCIFDVYEKQLALYNNSLKNPNPTNCVAYENFVSQTTYAYFKLVFKESRSSNTYLFIFECFFPTGENKTHRLFYDHGQHFLLKNVTVRYDSDSSKITEQSDSVELFTRAYTPIPNNIHTFDDRVSFATLIKIYNDGKMSKFIDNLKLGDLTKWRGPYGDFIINYYATNLLCLTQGTGIAPVYAVVHDYLENESCETRIHLLSCFRNLSDVIVREELSVLKDFWNFDYTLYLPYENTEADTFSTSLKHNEVVERKKIAQVDIDKYFNLKIVKENGTVVLICGTKVFMEDMTNLLKNYEVQQIHTF